MTIEEALIAELDEVQINRPTLEKVIINQGLVGQATFVPFSHQRAVDLAVVEILEKVLSRPNISEGDYSISHNQEGIKARIKAIRGKYGLVDPNTPSVRGVRPW